MRCIQQSRIAYTQSLLAEKGPQVTIEEIIEIVIEHKPIMNVLIFFIRIKNTISSSVCYINRMILQI